MVNNIFYDYIINIRKNILNFSEIILHLFYISVTTRILLNVNNKD